jgi:NUMOD1 domain
MRIAASKTFKSPEFLTNLSKGQLNGIKVEVTDLETNTTTTYHTIKATARALDIDRRYIEHYIYLKQDKPVLVRGKNSIFKLNLNSEDESTNLIQEKVKKTSMKVEVTNVDTKEVIIYSSISSAAIALGYRQPSISLYLKENRTKPFKGKYLFKLVN